MGMTAGAFIQKVRDSQKLEAEIADTFASGLEKDIDRQLDKLAEGYVSGKEVAVYLKKPFPIAQKTWDAVVAKIRAIYIDWRIEMELLQVPKATGEDYMFRMKLKIEQTRSDMR